jgi:recombinational DNA repair protein RecR
VTGTRIDLTGERTIVIGGKIEPITERTVGIVAKIDGITAKNIAGRVGTATIKEVITPANSTTGADTAKEHVGNSQFNQRLESISAYQPLYR